MKILTPRDVISAGGAVTDELLEPFISGDSDQQREQSRRDLRQAVTGCMSFFSKLTQQAKEEELDVPIITIASEPEKKKAPARSRTRNRKGGKK